MLEISPRKVAYVILQAREMHAAKSELSAFIRGLNTDEQAALVAVMWIGRDTYDAADLDEAMATAREEATIPTEEYLLGVPLLSDYLEEGLEKLGIDPSDDEDDLLAHH
ncbi:MAG: DUF3775 domain-containing protein [Paracoccaceae bacterium]